MALERRSSAGTIGRAVVVGALCAVPAVLLVVLVLVFVQTVAAGVRARQALGRMWPLDGEDLEAFAAFVLPGIAVGALVGLLAAAVWLGLVERVRPWLAVLVAALVAAAARGILLIIDGSAVLGLASAVAAGVITVVALPRVGYIRSARHRGAVPAAS